MSVWSGIIFSAFLVCCMIDLIADAKTCTRVIRVVKPFLMPLLLLFYVTSARQPNVFIILALFCGFLGDTFLLGNGIRFLLGLFAFLAGHVFYIIAFINSLGGGTIPTVVWFALPVYLLGGLTAYHALLPSIDRKLRPATVAYLVFLLAMSFASLLRCQSASGAAFSLPFLGSLFFVASDTMLAFEVFQKRSGRCVMFTYLVAQFFIVTGFLI